MSKTNIAVCGVGFAVSSQSKVMGVEKWSEGGAWEAREARVGRGKQRWMIGVRKVSVGGEGEIYVIARHDERMVDGI